MYAVDYGEGHIISKLGSDLLFQSMSYLVSESGATAVAARQI